MRKLLLIILMLTTCAFGADKLHVKALEPFNTAEPAETFKVQTIEDGDLDHVFLAEGTIINCVLDKIKDPKRLKKDAKIYLRVHSYTDFEGEHEVSSYLVAKYAKTVMNAEYVKELPSPSNLKKAAGTIGNHFFKGFSYGLSFADGIVENKEGNRLKSGAKQVYEDSFLSMVEKGQQIQIEKDDEFYLVISKKD